MNRLVLPAAFKVEPHLAQHLLAESPLFLLIVVTEENGVVNGVLLLGNGPHQRHQSCFQLIENPGYLGCLHLWLKQVQQGIVKAVFVAQGLGHLDVEVHDFPEVGLKVGVVGFGSGLNPGFVS